MNLPEYTDYFLENNPEVIYNTGQEFYIDEESLEAFENAIESVICSLNHYSEARDYLVSFRGISENSTDYILENLPQTQIRKIAEKSVMETMADITPSYILEELYMFNTYNFTEYKEIDLLVKKRKQMKNNKIINLIIKSDSLRRLYGRI